MRVHSARFIGSFTIGIGCAAAQPVEPQLDPAVADYPVVLTPTRLRQSLADVPASVTVITAEMIRQFGIMNVPDALRLVPGMSVTQVLGNDYRINYHGTNILDPRRMNVLVDGISVYRPALSRVDWKQLPVAIEDIDRIEVTRGPNSAAYGRNSMLAVVNIITKHPSDVERAMISTTFGSLNTRAVTGRLSAALGNTALRVSLSAENDNGFDAVSRGSEAHDSTRLKRLNARSETRTSNMSSLGLEVAFVSGTAEVPFVDAFQTSFPDQHTRDYYAGVVWNTSFSPTHALQIRASYSNQRIRQEWQTCVPAATLLPELFALYAANPQFANTLLTGRIPTGGSPAETALVGAAVVAIQRLGVNAIQPTCSTANQNLVESRADLEVQDTFVFSDHLRVVGGAGVRDDRGSSVTYLGGTVSNLSYRAFANVEYRPYADLTLNAGGYFERDQLTGSTFSPRVGANVRLSEAQTLRAAFSQGRRQPDIFEQRANWTYSGTDLMPPLNGSSSGRFFQSAVARGDLADERITSREAGYMLRIPAWGMLLDVKAFHDTLTDLISEKLHLQSFQPTNSNSVRLTGAEWQTMFSVPGRWTLFLNYAYLRNHATTELERTQYSSHSGALGASRPLGDGWRFSVAYYGASGNGVGQNYYGREDLVVSKTFRVSASPATASLILRHLDQRSVTHFRDFGDIVRSKYDDSFQIYGYVKLSF